MPPRWPPPRGAIRSRSFRRGRGAARSTISHPAAVHRGSGFGEGSFLGNPALNVVAFVASSRAEFLIDGALWHLGYPAASRAGIERAGSGPHRMQSLRTRAIELASRLAGRLATPVRCISRRDDLHALTARLRDANSDYPVALRQ